MAVIEKMHSRVIERGERGKKEWILGPS